MKKSWTNGLSPEDKKQMESEYRIAAPLRERLVELLEQEIKARQHKGRSEELYKLPNWELYQADIHGATRALEHVISLIK